MSTFVPNNVNFIIKLEIQSLLDGLFSIKADGEEVYYGNDKTVAGRWIEYYRTQTPWQKIYQKELKSK